MSENSDVENVEWWAPSGWRSGLPPQPYMGVLQDQQDFYTSMREHGYDNVKRVGSALDLELLGPDLEVWRHLDGHLIVFLGETERFFVSDGDRMPFWVQLFPVLESQSLERQRTDALWLQAKAMAAWVRHGHGIDTIDEFGETKEERRRRHDDLRRQNEMKAAAALGASQA